jgi:hypothetical protein
MCQIRIMFSFRWHSLSVSVQSGQTVEVSLDGVVEKMTAQHGDASLDLPPSVYYGGMDISASTFGWLIKSVSVFSTLR